MMHNNVADRIVEIVKTTWASEASLEAYFNKFFQNLPLKGNESTLVLKLLKEAWEAEQEESPFKLSLETTDLRTIFLDLATKLDANLWSQLYLNSPLWTTPMYDLATATKRMDALQVRFAKEETTPWDIKAKMKDESEENLEWNEAVALLRSIKSVREMGHTSYRLYPYGATPALSDSANVSMINSKIWDRYILRPQGKITLKYYEDMDPVLVSPAGDKAFTAEGFEGVFTSKSGDMSGLCRVLTIRQFVRDQFVLANGITQLIPRWGSVTIID
jgi:hypothetical protein